MPMNKPHLEFTRVDMSAGWATPPGYPGGIQQKGGTAVHAREDEGPPEDVDFFPVVAGGPTVPVGMAIRNRNARRFAVLHEIGLEDADRISPSDRAPEVLVLDQRVIHAATAV